MKRQIIMNFSKKFVIHLHDRILNILTTVNMKHLCKLLKKSDGLDLNFGMALVTISQQINDKIQKETTHKLKQTYVDAFCAISDLISFLNNGAKIYKFNDDFLKDYLNYPLNFDTLIKSNSLNFISDNIFISGKNLAEIELQGKSYSFDVMGLTNFTDSNGNFILSHLSSLEHRYNYVITFATDDKFNLLNAYHNLKDDANITPITKNLLKLLFYIRSSNVDLREVSPEILDKNATKKEKSKIDNNNFKNDSFIKYFKVGYAWNKLPIYKKEEWEVQGHFRMQACGKNHQEHKIVFVNQHTKKRQIKG